MSYQTVKDGIIGILRGLAYQESSEAFDFVNASDQEYGNTFIIKALSGEVIETLGSTINDKQTWEILFAFEQSSQNEIINMDETLAAKDTIVTALDNPTNWTSFVREMRYVSWKIEKQPSYYLLTITLNVVDTYTY